MFPNVQTTISFAPKIALLTHNTLIVKEHMAHGQTCLISTEIIKEFYHGINQ